MVACGHGQEEKSSRGGPGSEGWEEGRLQGRKGAVGRRLGGAAGRYSAPGIAGAMETPQPMTGISGEAYLTAYGVAGRGSALRPDTEGPEATPGTVCARRLGALHGVFGAARRSRATSPATAPLTLRDSSRSRCPDRAATASSPRQRISFPPEPLAGSLPAPGAGAATSTVGRGARPSLPSSTSHPAQAGARRASRYGPHAVSSPARTLASRSATRTVRSWSPRARRSAVTARLQVGDACGGPTRGLPETCVESLDNPGRPRPPRGVGRPAPHAPPHSAPASLGRPPPAGSPLVSDRSRARPASGGAPPASLGASRG